MLKDFHIIIFYILILKIEFLMKKKLITSLKSGIGSYFTLIIFNYIIYIIFDWSILDEIIPSISLNFFTISIFGIIIMSIVDFFFYKGKY